jgi:uncharacterized Zn finger protein (UPF0148 family)
METKCAKGHKLRWECFQQGPSSCRTCDDEERKEEAKRKRDAALEEERQARQRRYADELARLQDEIAQKQNEARGIAEDAERARVLLQHQKDLEDATAAVDNLKLGTSTAAAASSSCLPTKRSMGRDVITSVEADTKATASVPLKISATSPLSQDANALVPPPTSSPPLATKPSAAQIKWEHQKKFENARNGALDELMSMIGLEEVKNEFLAIKAKIDTAVRQGISTKDERFGAVLLGNPGTGIALLRLLLPPVVQELY